MKETYDKFKSELLDSCIPFWLSHGVDEEYGGLLNCLDRYGRVYSEDKSVWMQCRCGWTFSYIYNNVDKKPEYLKLAKSCIDFATEHCIDKEDGRMFFTVTRDGKPLRKRRYKFSETFYIIANAEYYMASGDEEYLKRAKDYFNFVFEIYKDPAKDPYRITPKSYSETRNLKSLADPMILLNVASIMRDADKDGYAFYDGIITELIAEIKGFYKPKYRAMFETLTVEGEVVLNSAPCRIINPGHDIECAWFLIEEAVKRGDKETFEFAKTVFDDAFVLGWDKEYGGITYFKDVLGMPVEAYEHDMKLWWPHNETIIASLMLYKHTGDEKYREIFKMVCDYAFEHFSDREYGEWLGYLRRDGKPTEPPCKGHTYKGPFHVMRMLSKCILLLEDMTDTGRK